MRAQQCGQVIFPFPFDLPLAEGRSETAGELGRSRRAGGELGRSRRAGGAAGSGTGKGSGSSDEDVDGVAGLTFAVVPSTLTGVSGSTSTSSNSESDDNEELEGTRGGAFPLGILATALSKHFTMT